MSIDIVRLRHLARRAPRGERQVSISSGDEPPSMYFVDRGCIEIARFPRTGNPHFKNDALLCAALDPATVLALLDRLEEAERHLEELGYARSTPAIFSPRPDNQ